MSADLLTRADQLRLNVLVTQPLQALRIDESRMVVHALSERGEASVELNPDCREDIYLKRVRELLSGHFLGSPGGYPVFLRRWTRMGQARAASLEKLLLLGEEEAAVAVVHSPDLSPELARRVWWAYPNAENARRMLERECVASSDLGRELAAYLLDYLPFETEHRAIIDSIRLVLLPGLLEQDRIEWLWNQSRRRNTYLAGFLAARPDDLPDESAAAHPAAAELTATLRGVAEDSVLAAYLLRLLAAPGQAFLDAVARVLHKPADQEVVVALFEVLEAYFAGLRPHRAKPQCRDATQLAAAVARELGAAAAVAERIPDRVAMLESVLVLANAGEQLVAPILGRSDAVGTVLRKQLKPATDPVWRALDSLLG